MSVFEEAVQYKKKYNEFIALFNKWKDAVSYMRKHYDTADAGIIERFEKLESEMDKYWLTFTDKERKRFLLNEIKGVYNPYTKANSSFNKRPR